MSATQALLPFVLLASGMAAGVMMWTQLGGWPLLASLPPDRYVATHAFFARKYDPFMPTCFLITVAGGIALAVSTGQPTARTLFVVSSALAVISIGISLRKNVPVNRWLQTLDPDSLPVDFASVDPRRDWGLWNRIRAGLAILAFAANCGALVALL